MDSSLELLSVAERVAYYRHMAAERLRLARAATDPEKKAAYLANAERWRALAAKVERLQEHVVNHLPR